MQQIDGKLKAHRPRLRFARGPQSNKDRGPLFLVCNSFNFCSYLGYETASVPVTSLYGFLLFIKA